MELNKNNPEEIYNESKPIMITDDMGREIFWKDLGRPDGE